MPHNPRRRETFARPSFPVILTALAVLAALTAGLPRFIRSTAHAAAAFNVNSTGDAPDANTADNLCDDGAGNCTLRAAIQEANAAAGADSVNISVTGTINLTGALPDITDNLTIGGPGSSLLTVRRDTGGDYRVFTIDRETNRNTLVVAISGLTVANGRTPAGFSHEFAGGADGGGGLSNGGALTLTDVTFSGNGTGAGGTGARFGGSGGNGGAVSNFGTLTMTNVTLTGNSTGAGGAAGTAGDGGNGGAVFNMGTLTMTGCVVRGNATGGGGQSSDSGREGGDAGDGGGVASIVGPLTMTECYVAENMTGAGGNSSGGSGGDGGSGAGIYSGHGATLTGISVVNNVAGRGGVVGIAGPAGRGGGVYFDAGFGYLTNSTVSGNRALGSGGGGAVYNSGFGTTTLTNCTITANEGPGVVAPSAAPVVRNTIIAGNAGGTGPDVSGAFNSYGHNLVGDAGAATGFTAGGDRVGTSAARLDPRLGPLADNGGATPTHALLAGSPALDAGSNALAIDRNANLLATDQRGAGFPRFADSADADAVQTVDIGAFEAHPSVEDVTHKATSRNTPLSFSFNVGDAALGITSVTAASSNQTLVPDANLSISGDGTARTLLITPAAGLTGTATITLTVTAANSRTMSDTFVLSVDAFNAAPVFTKGADLTVAEDSGPQTFAGWATAIGPGSPDESGQSVSFVVTGNTNPGLFSAAPSVSPGGTLTFTPAPNANGSADITIVLKDNGGTDGGGHDTSAPQTFTVNVTAVNDAPFNSVPVTQTANGQSPLVFSGPNGFSVADVDAGTAPVRLTLAATNGTLTLGGTAGLAFVTGDGADDAAMSFTGTLAAVNAALNGMTFKAAQGFTGAASIQLTANDQGNTGSGGAKSDADTVAVNVTTVSGGQLLLFAPFETFETMGTLTIRVGRSFGGGGATSVNFATSGGTAAGGASCGAGVDYVSASGTLSWADGETADKSFTVTLCDDSSHEPDETLGVTLSNLTGSATLGSTSTTVTLRDDDPAGGRVEFSQAVYTAGEGSGRLTVTVNRTGDTGLAAGVDYETDDNSTPGFSQPCSVPQGIALERCDFTRAAGRLLFAAGEAQKTFDVLLTDDSYVEGNEVAFVRLGNPGGGAILGQRTVATLEVADDSPESPTNPANDSAKFVRQHYHDFFSRDADAPGLAHWTNVIESCGSDVQCREVNRINTSGAFFLSIEFKETGYLVERIYKAAYGDAVGNSTLGGTAHTLAVPVVRFEEFLRDTQHIGGGVVVLQPGWEAQLEANKVAFTREFVQRARFTAAFPLSMTPAQFVEQLNGRAGNPLDATERQNLINELTANNTTAGRASVLRKVAEDPTLADAEINRAFVLMQYFGYLRRNPNEGRDTDYTGYDFWLGNLEKAGGNFVRAELVKAFISSDEYRQRFGQ